MKMFILLALALSPFSAFANPSDLGCNLLGQKKHPVSLDLSSRETYDKNGHATGSEFLGLDVSEDGTQIASFSPQNPAYKLTIHQTKGTWHVLVHEKSTDKLVAGFYYRDKTQSGSFFMDLPGHQLAPTAFDCQD